MLTSCEKRATRLWTRLVLESTGSDTWMTKPKHRDSATYYQWHPKSTKHVKVLITKEKVLGSQNEVFRSLGCTGEWTFQVFSTTSLTHPHFWARNQVPIATADPSRRHRFACFLADSMARHVQKITDFGHLEARANHQLQKSKVSLRKKWKNVLANHPCHTFMIVYLDVCCSTMATPPTLPHGMLFEYFQLLHAFRTLLSTAKLFWDAGEALTAVTTLQNMPYPSWGSCFFFHQPLRPYKVQSVGTPLIAGTTA